MNRRQFFASFFVARGPAPEALRLAVIEVIRSDSGLSALLVHHADAGQRSRVSRWLRERDGGRAQFRLPDGQEITGQVSRVKMCFGRGLVLTDQGDRIKVKDVLTAN